tara:strand:+ start:195 stop:1493 length:1299 start_codon:yes stop_codon:yes gene_type:complete
MDPRDYQGILWLADLQEEFELWDIKKFKRDRKLVLTLRRKRRRGRCSGCGCLSDRIHSTERVRLRDLSAFGYQVTLVVQRFTLRCSSCELFLVESHPLWRKRRSFTWRYECHVSHLCEELTNLGVARLEGLNDKTVFNIDHELLQLRMQHQNLPELGPHYSMDEVYFRYFPNWHKDKEKSFVTNLLDLTHRKVISNAPGRSQKSAENCLFFLSKSQKRKAKSFATDLHSPYHRAIRKHCPHADIVLDRFHIMQLFSEAMNEFRKKQLSMAQDFNEIRLLKGDCKWLLLTKEQKLNQSGKALLEELKSLNERVVDALLVREKLQHFFQSPHLKIAKIRWFQFQKLIHEVDIPQFYEFYRKLKKWLPELWNYFHHKTTSAVIEALNHKIKVTRACAYGYKNLSYYRLKILQRVGFLNSRFAPLPQLLKNQGLST